VLGTCGGNCTQDTQIRGTTGAEIGARITRSIADKTIVPAGDTQEHSDVDAGPERRCKVSRALKAAAAVAVAVAVDADVAEAAAYLSYCNLRRCCCRAASTMPARFSSPNSVY
jgi:hypothetical protein